MFKMYFTQTSPLYILHNTETHFRYSCYSTSTLNVFYMFFNFFILKITQRPQSASDILLGSESHSILFFRDKISTRWIIEQGKYYENSGVSERTHSEFSSG